MLACTLLCLVLPLGGAKRSYKKDGASAASLIRLAEKGDHIALERHLQAGASASTLDREGTLLTHAAAAGHVDTIEVVLKYGGTDRATIDRQVRTPVFDGDRTPHPPTHRWTSRSSVQLTPVTGLVPGCRSVAVVDRPHF
eukprot:COSAG02_NODE_39_length_48074_cov_106.508890_39_plen_140_part_00